MWTHVVTHVLSVLGCVYTHMAMCPIVVWPSGGLAWCCVQCAERKKEGKKEKVKSLSCVRPFATPWIVAHQAPRPWNFPGKDTGVDCHFLLQGIFRRASLEAQMVESLPAVQETRVQCAWLFPFHDMFPKPS